MLFISQGSELVRSGISLSNHFTRSIDGGNEILWAVLMGKRFWFNELLLVNLGSWTRGVQARWVCNTPAQWHWMQ